VVDDQPGESWSRIEAEPLAGAPFELWTSRYVSRADDTETLLHRPASELARGITGIDGSWHIATLMTNHERGVEWHPLVVLALIDREERRATLITYKLPPNEPPTGG
jgi:hypothetical protein